jgi:hypothetical protein
VQEIGVSSQEAKLNVKSTKPPGRVVFTVGRFLHVFKADPLHDFIDHGCGLQDSASVVLDKRELSLRINSASIRMKMSLYY